MAEIHGAIAPQHIDAKLGAEHDDQRAAVAFLEKRESYGDDVSAVERIDTHVSTVFLAGKYAYKLKRSVRFSYLDFSTVARREATCRAELALNKRTAPELYLAVRSITRAPDGSLAFEGAGEVIDWVVVMLRFDQSLLFDRLAARGALDERLMERLSAEIARFHAAAEQTPYSGGRASIEAEISGNEQNLAIAPPDIFPRQFCTALVDRWRVELDRYGALLDRRDKGGKVRRCHGDLHLRNICLWHDRPTLFDCIEFNEHLACIDVLYDLAFLLMDLQHRGLGAFANLVFNTYLDCNDESDGIAALPLMMSLRAAIRAHTGLAAAHSQADPEHRQASTNEAREYLFLAERLLRDETPRLVAIGGLSGTGKSTLARAIGSDFGRVPGARLLHTDALRKRLFGVAKTKRLGGEAYEPAVSKRVYRLQREEAATHLCAGCSVIVDGVFAQAEERIAIAATARDFGVPFTGLWLTAADDLLRARVARRSNDMSDATCAVLETQLQGELGEIDWIEINAAGDAADSADLARAALTRRSDRTT